jgi:hypothetical protein
MILAARAAGDLRSEGGDPRSTVSTLDSVGIYRNLAAHAVALAKVRIHTLRAPAASSLPGWRCERTMNAEQINAVGGWCELVGVAFLVRDLMSMARFLEPRVVWAARYTQWAAHVRAWWVATPVMGWWRRLLRWLLRRRSGPAVEATAITATVTASANDAMARAGRMPGPFTLRPGQRLEDQIAELGLLLNRLREEVMREPQERDRVIAAEREARHEEVRAEAEERERGDAKLQGDIDKLRDVTTGDLGLKVESVLYLGAGIILTAWPDLVAEWLDWLQFRVALTIVLGWPVLRSTWLRGPLVRLAG